MTRRSLLSAAAMLAGITSLRAMAPVRLAHPDDSDDPLWRSNGLCRQLLEEVVVRSAKIPLTFLPLPWLRAQRMVATGEADALLCPKSIVRNGLFRFSGIPTIVLKSYWLVRRDDPRFAANGPEDVPGLVRLDVLGDDMPQSIPLPDARSTSAPDRKSQVTMIARNRADIAPILELRGRYLLRQLGLEDQLSLMTSRRQVNFYFGIRRDYPDAVSLIHEVEEAIARSSTAGTIDRIYKESLNDSIEQQRVFIP